MTCATRSAYQKPTEGFDSSQEYPPHDSCDQVGGDQTDPDYEMDFRHGRGSLGPVAPRKPLERVGIRLADAEKHYVTPCYKVLDAVV